MNSRRHRLLGLALGPALLAGLANPVEARIVSYAPVSDRYAMPAVQHRENRHYLLAESDFPTSFSWAQARLVLYDSQGEAEPRVILEGTDSYVTLLAFWEGADGSSFVLVGTDADLAGENPQHLHRVLFSSNEGATWQVVDLPAGSWPLYGSVLPDVGGPVARGWGSQVRLGTRDFPFVLAVGNASGIVEISAVRSNGTVRHLASLDGASAGGLIGSDQSGKRFLLAGAVRSAPPRNAVRILDLYGNLQEVVALESPNLGLQGWITPSGSVYLEDFGFYGLKSLALYERGRSIEVSPPRPVFSAFDLTYFAAPTADFSGAWIVERGVGLPTILSRHQAGAPPVEQWRDISGPAVEAIHAGRSGRKLLIQADRPRPQADQRIFQDPALALWEIGAPAPQHYDELFLNEGYPKGFVHLDVEAVWAGEPFVFDSAPVVSGGVAPSAGGGGAEVTQEWGVVRASLRQRLVLPAVARLEGAFGSIWRSDVILQNPSEESVAVAARFAPSSLLSGEPREVSIILLPRETRVLADALMTLFGLSNGAGALFLTPEGSHAISVTSRLYAVTEQGTYGMGLGAVDVFAASSARFPLSFSGALPGSGFRTNLLTIDAANRDSRIALAASGSSGPIGREDFSFSTPANGQSQLNGLAQSLEVEGQPGALLFRPLSGEAIPCVVVIDNRTNDPTYFPPDLPSPYVRTIPAIGHLDGANGSKWRTDLFLFNPSEWVRTVTLAVRPWNGQANETILNLTLLPKESKVIRDVLFTAFRMTDVARLRYVSDSMDAYGIRVTSRTYTVDSLGGTYGFLMPSLNSFQSAGPGESLEILGAVVGADSRTNLSLVDLTAFPETAAPRVRIEIIGSKGSTVDSFEAAVPSAGGTQLVDLFRARGLSAELGPVVIRVSPFGGLIGAYATMIDSGTNDPTYLAAGLSAR